MKKILSTILVLTFLISTFTVPFHRAFAEIVYDDNSEKENSINLMTESLEGMPENAVVLKDIFTDDYVDCMYGGWSLNGNIADDNVKVGEKSFKVDFNENGVFGQGGITFNTSISGDSAMIQAAIAGGYAYVGVWEYIPSGTSWFEIRLNQDNVLRTNERDKWIYVYQPLTKAGNNGKFIYVKNQSKKSYWFDNMQIFMIPPEDTSMTVSKVDYYNKNEEKSDNSHVYVKSPIEIIFSQCIIGKTAEIKLSGSTSDADIPVSLVYEDNVLRVMPLSALEYDTEYEISVSNVTNMFGETVDESKFKFRTAKPEFRIENISYTSDGEEISVGDKVTSVKMNADVINNSKTDKSYHLVLAVKDDSGNIKFACSDNTLCKAESTNNDEISIDGFGEISVSDNSSFTYMFVGSDNIAVDEEERLTDDSFAENTTITLKGDRLKLDAAFSSGRKQKLTMAMLRYENDTVDWKYPGYFVCGETDELGNYTAEKTVSGYTASGNYVIYIWGEGTEDKYESYAYYTGKDKRDEISKIIRNGSTSEITAMLENNDNKTPLSSMGIMIDDYINLSDKKSYVSEYINKCSTSIKTTEKECVEILNKYIVLAKLKESDNKTQVLIENEDILNISERIRQSIDNIKNNDKLACFSTLFDKMQYTDTVSFESQLNQIITIAGANAVDEGDYPKMLEHLGTYSDIILYDTAKKMNDNNISEYNKVLLIKSLICVGYTSVADIRVEIEAGIEKYRPKKTNTGGGGGGYSSGGSNSSNKGGFAGITYPSLASEAKPVTPTNEVNTFNDLAGAEWAKSSILELTQRKIISGYDDNTFRPQNNITRAEFTKIIMSALFDSSISENSDFYDVPNTHWAYSYISGAYAKKLINGVSDNTFAPDEYITNEQMSVICCRAVEVAGIEFSEKASDAFSDFNDVSDYAKMSVVNMQKWEIIAGDDNMCFNPHQYATRAQTAKIIYSIISKKGDTE